MLFLDTLHHLGRICYIAFDTLCCSLTRYIPLVTRSVIPRHATTHWGYALFLPDTPQLTGDMLVSILECQCLKC